MLPMNENYPHKIVIFAILIQRRRSLSDPAFVEFYRKQKIFSDILRKITKILVL
jgi:hypothetical protein